MKMNNPIAASVVALLVVGGVGCGGDAADTGELDTATEARCAETYQVTWQNWGDGFFATYCRACHSSTTPDRLGAPEGIDFDTKSDVQMFEAAIRSTVLEEESMPVGGGVYDDDLLLLEILLDCDI